MAREARLTKLQAEQWRKSLDLATSLSEDASRKQAGCIRKLKEDLREARSAQYAAEIELKKQKEAVEEAKKSDEEARKTMATWEKAYNDLDAQMDLIKAKVKFAEDRLAEEQSSFKTRLANWKDAFVDTDMYRVWTYKPNIDLSFL